MCKPIYADVAYASLCTDFINNESLDVNKYAPSIANDINPPSREHGNERWTIRRQRRMKLVLVGIRNHVLNFHKRVQGLRAHPLLFTYPLNRECRRIAASRMRHQPYGNSRDSRSIR
ncbi:hypothetical protein PUN28_003160 [Cardiocondyla obscurior]|uniref:Uncharacterized protein n=1 Tax=Cardiocondyla obscurior TaxID=286306 RepID=A0AAW2GMB7_9HYME